MTLPLRSMTGFGAAAEERSGVRVSVEIRAVNHRMLQFHVRAHPNLGALEQKVRELAGAMFLRGHVNIAVELVRTKVPPEAILNSDLAGSAILALRSLAQAHELPGGVTVADLVHVPGIFENPADGSFAESDWALLETALRAACREALEMREAEGAALRAALMAQAEALKRFAALAEERAPLAVERVRKRLAGRLAELQGAAPGALDAQALERETVWFADRADIAEELERLRSHLAQFQAALEAGGEAGKRLEFLAQEMLREVNTVASKANDTGIAEASIAAKLAVEKIKEQAANVE
ncbi:MAG: YicC/YloC family endoribonuclease [Planctomycetota bacterium]